MQRRNFLKVIPLPFFFGIKDAFGYLFPPKKTYLSDDLTYLDFLKNFTGTIEGVGEVSISYPPGRTTICQSCGDFCRRVHSIRQIGHMMKCQSCQHAHEIMKPQQLEIMTKPRRFLDLHETWNDYVYDARHHLRLESDKTQLHHHLFEYMDVIRTSDGVMIKCL